MSESELIALIKNIFADNVAEGARALVDDCAWMTSVPAGKTRVISCDGFQEGNDFLLSLSPTFFAGHKAVTQNLSDLAAAGATPGGFVWSLEIPESWLKDDAKLVREFVQGAAKAAQEGKLLFYGGDLSRSLGSFSCSITIWGDCAQPFSRTYAKPGDLICVSGQLGAASTGLNLLRELSKTTSDLHLQKEFNRLLTSRSSIEQEAIWEHVQPKDHHLVAQKLSGLIGACIDVSDGLSRDLHHLCRASQVGAVLDNLSAAIHPAASIDAALYGGEDFVLLYTIRDQQALDLVRAQVGESHAIVIGRITNDSGKVFWQDGKKSTLLPERGWDHFASFAAGQTSL